MLKRNHLLMNILRALVEDCGHDEVVRALAQLPGTNNHTGLNRATKRPPGTGRSLSRDVVKQKRPNAVDMAAKVASEIEEPHALMTLAARFDRKEFLPSNADIREFLAMMGKTVEGVKDRIEGFRYLLPLLVELPPERLKKLADSATHSGPAQLGPLADAIRLAGAAMQRGDREADTGTQANPSGVSPAKPAQDMVVGRSGTSGLLEELDTLNDVVGTSANKPSD